MSAWKNATNGTVLLEEGQRMPPASDAIVMLVIYIVIGIPGFIGNVFTVFVVCASRNFRKSVTYVKIGSLALSDGLNLLGYILAGILSTAYPHDVTAWWRHEVMGKVLGWLWHASLNNMIIIAIDRFFCIAFYASFRKMMTMKRTVVLIALSWGIAALQNGPHFTGHCIFVYVHEYLAFIELDAPLAHTCYIISLVSDIITIVTLFVTSVVVTLLIRIHRKKKSHLMGVSWKRSTRIGPAQSSGMQSLSAGQLTAGTSAARLTGLESSRTNDDIHTQVSQPSDTTTPNPNKPTPEEVRVALQFAVVFAIYLIEVGFYYLLFSYLAPIVDIGPLGLVASVTFYLHFSINIVVYLAFSKMMRNEYLGVIRKCAHPCA